MKLYRFETFQFTDVGVICNEYEVTKETPAGYWIADWTAKKGKRWVSKTGFKRFAYTDKVAAADSYLARCSRYLNILTTRQEATIEALGYFKEHMRELVKEPPIKLLEYKPVNVGCITATAGANC